MARLDDLAAALAEIDTLGARLRAIASAPPSLAERLAAAEAEARRAAEDFQTRPFFFGNPLSEAGLRRVLIGLVAVVAPKISQQLIEAQVRATAQADPRPPLDSAARSAGLAETEAAIAAIAGGFGPDDLQILTSAAANAHAVYRGLAERRDEVRRRVDRRVAGIAALVEESEAAPLAPQPDMPPPQLAPLAERAAAVASLIAEEEASLAKDNAELAGIERECAAAAGEWRRLAALGERLEQLLRQHPPAAAQAA